jgi:hypothetical protein
MTWGDLTPTADPVYGVHWGGETYLGPEGDRFWGLDSGDQALTGNSVCMDTYLAATQSYIDYCTAKGYNTKVFFTTGPVDSFTGEAGYQGYLKHEHIRNYVKADPTRILFDYADILCYDNGSETPTSTTWNGHTYPIITATNLGSADIGHIGSVGRLRIAKAMWWMLARIAGWNGGTTGINDPVEETLSSALIETTKDELRIKLTEAFLTGTVSLYNLQGNLIAEQMAAGYTSTFNISHLPSGIYFIVLSSSKITQTHKIVIS